MRSSKYLPYLYLMHDMRTSQNKVKLFQEAHVTMERIFSQGSRDFKAISIFFILYTKVLRYLCRERYRILFRNISVTLKSPKKMILREDSSHSYLCLKKTSHKKMLFCIFLLFFSRRTTLY